MKKKLRRSTSNCHFGPLFGWNPDADADAAGVLGSQTEFQRRYARVIKAGQRHSATASETAEMAGALTSLQKKMSSFFLRR